MIHPGHMVKCHISLFGFGRLTGKLCSRQAGKVSCSEEPADSPSWSLISSAGQEPHACLSTVLFTAPLPLLFCPLRTKDWQNFCSEIMSLHQSAIVPLVPGFWNKHEPSDTDRHVSAQAQPSRICRHYVSRLSLHLGCIIHILTYSSLAETLCFGCFSSGCTYRNLLKSWSAFC